MTSFTTRDLYLSSVLVTLKFPLLKVDIQMEGQHQNAVGYFTFEKTEDLKHIESRYLHNDLLVEPRNYVAIMRNLKDQVTNIASAPR